MTTAPRAEPVFCSHCGLPVPPGFIEPGLDEQFCCEGCRVVYTVIHEQGLERYYRLKADLDPEPRAAVVTKRSYDELDDPAFRELHARPAGRGLLSVELTLENVHCAACVWLVERVPKLDEGVVEVRLDVGKRRARVVYDPERTRLSSIARMLDRMGYPVHPFRAADAEAIARREDRRLLLRMGVAGASAGNIMLIAFCLYGGMFTGIEPAIEQFFRFASLMLALPAVLYSAQEFYRGALGALRARALHMDVPVSIGVLAGFAWGAHNVVTNRGEIYFDCVALVVFLLLVGRWLVRRQQRHAANAAELLMSLAPSSARVVEEVSGRVREVPVEALRRGALVEVLSGGSLPADGVVVEGRSSLDRSLLTGESRPESVAPGAEVHAGTVNLGARLLVRVAEAGEATRLGRLLALVEEHATRKAPVVRLADRVSAFFVAVVLALAALTFGIWQVLDPEQAVDHAVALLIVTCPCALGLATPLAVSAALGQAARRGILLKGGDVVERLARPGRLWLDKTGTLTEGRTRVVRIWGDEEVGRDVAALEAGSAHPVGRALVAHFAPAGPAEGEGAPALRAVAASLPRAEEVEEVLGRGVTGLVGGRRVLVGSARFARESGLDLGADATEALLGLLDEGLSPVVVAREGRVRALVGLGDPLRHEAGEAVSALRRMGFSVGVLSGDHPLAVAAVARSLGIDASSTRGGVSPEEKLAIVRESAERGPVVMVGDGVNDAAALAAATAGVAVHGGAEAAMAAADVFVTREGLTPIVRALEGARRTLGVIRRNLVLSLVYNVLGAGLAMAGLINPLVAAVLMPLSSLTVIASSYRARTFAPLAGELRRGGEEREERDSWHRAPSTAEAAGRASL